MLKKILVVLLLAIAGILGLAATKPDEFRFERRGTIKAPPEKVFAILNDFKQWDKWSPWEKKDPAMKRTFGPTTSGKGATYAWEGNKDVGQGSMEITESLPSSKIAINLNFIKPFEAQNKVEFVLLGTADTTTVTWAMQGKCNFISKIIQVFVSMDKMVGPDFEAGLANLKTAAEKS
jgi:uncharacterized protein YndB with AHSA1/START domain